MEVSKIPRASSEVYDGRAPGVTQAVYETVECSKLSVCRGIKADLKKLEWERIGLLMNLATRRGEGEEVGNGGCCFVVCDEDVFVELFLEVHLQARSVFI